MLFQFDVTRNGVDLVQRFWDGRKVVPAVQTFANQLVEGVIQRLQELDDLIQKYTEHWSLERMAVVDRNVLRLAIYEILYMESIPVKVSINEAIEITKKYSDQQSGAFINGILDRIVKEEARAQCKREVTERGLHAGNDSL